MICSTTSFVLIFIPYIYPKTSSNTSVGRVLGLKTTNKRSLALLSGGASFFGGGRLASVWMRDTADIAEKPWRTTTHLGFITFYRLFYQVIRYSWWYSKKILGFTVYMHEWNLEVIDNLFSVLTGDFITWLVDGPFHTADIIWAATNCMAIRPTELHTRTHKWETAFKWFYMLINISAQTGITYSSVSWHFCWLQDHFHSFIVTHYVCYT